MGSRFSIDAVFRAVDQLTAPLKKMTVENKRFTRALKKDFAAAQRQVANFGPNIQKSIGRAVKTTLLAGLAAVAVGAGIAAREYVGFENAVTSASAKFGPAFQRGTEGFTKLQKAARQVGATTEFTATQAAEGLDFLALAGFKAEQAMSLLPGVIDLATSAQTDFSTASSIASDSLGAFNLMTDDSAQLGKNFTRVMDVMTKTTVTSNTGLTDLFEAVRSGAPSFTAAGQSLETFNALAGIMANAGVKGSEAGTGLRNVMLRLADATPEAQKVLKKLNVTTQDQFGNFRDIVDILADFEVGLNGVGTAERTAMLSTVFGARAVTGVNVLLAKGTQGLRDYRKQLEGATGASAEMAGVMRQSLQNQIATLKSAALELGFKFVEAFETKGVTVIQKITEAINKFDIKPVIDGIQTVFNIISGLLPILKFIGPIILGVVGAWKAYRIALIAVAVVQKALDVLMAANPLGIIITSIGALIGITVLLIQNWQKVKDFFAGVFDFILGGFRKIGGFFGKVGKFLGFGAEGVNAPGASMASISEPSYSVQAPTSPAERAAVTRSESVSRGEVVIRDETGRAESKRMPRGRGFKLSLDSSGAF